MRTAYEDGSASGSMDHQPLDAEVAGDGDGRRVSTQGSSDGGAQRTRLRGDATKVLLGEGDPPRVVYSAGVHVGALRTAEATLVGELATFSEPLPLNVGIGDEVTVPDVGVFFVSERRSAHELALRTATGSAPGIAQTTKSVTIRRAFPSLAAALAGAANAAHLDTLDLTSVGEGVRLEIACYGDGPDTQPVIATDYVTSEEHRLRIFTPTAATEVGVSQRHRGKWDESVYRLVSNTFCIKLAFSNVDVEGLQLKCHGLGIGVSIDGQSGRVSVERNIVRLDTAPNLTGTEVGIRGDGNGLPALEMNVVNNLVYEIGDGTSAEHVGILAGPGTLLRVFNNTVVGGYYGIKGSADLPLAATNNLVVGQSAQGAAYAIVNPGDPTQSNLSGDASAPGTDPALNATVRFVNGRTVNSNYHLVCGPGIVNDACGAGVDIGANPYHPFRRDIDGEMRSVGASWDVGADEVLLPTAVITSPVNGWTYHAGMNITMDATSSEVPKGYEAWFGAGPVNGGDSTMEVVYEANGLTGSFMASSAVSSYGIRVIVATPNAMPVAGSPCAPSTPCTMAEALVTKDDPPGPATDFSVWYAAAEIVLLHWSDISSVVLERSEDGATWGSGGLPATEPAPTYHYRDTSVVPGETYFYRIKATWGSPWTYLGGGSTAPGDPVTVPVWNAPRVVPKLARGLSSLHWELPEGASPYTGTATLRLRLEPEPGESLSGCTIAVFANEPTFQLNYVYEEGDSYDSPRGPDEPFCSTRAAEPTATVDVPLGQKTADIIIPGLRHGANGLRFYVTGADGSISERALLVPIHEALPAYDESVYSRPNLLPVFTGLEYDHDHVEPDVSYFAYPGYGPIPRFSPDCRDADFELYVSSVRRASSDYLGTNTAADANGLWTGQLFGFFGSADDTAYMQARKDTSDDPIGRSLTGVGQVPLEPTTSFLIRETSATTTISNILVHYEPVNAAPLLSRAPASLEALAWPGVGDGVGNANVRFRLVDTHQNLDLSSVCVANDTRDPGTCYHGYYAANQIGAEAGTGDDYGWFVAAVPVEAGVSSTLMFHATDTAGLPTDPTTSWRIIPAATRPPGAVLSAPSDGYTYEFGEVLTLDASASIVPLGSVVWMGAYENGDPLRPAVLGSDLTQQLVTSEEVASYTVRVVVADPASELTADQLGAGNPCDATQLMCDYDEVTIWRAVSTVIIDSPINGILFDDGATIEMRATSSSFPQSFAIWFAALIEGTDEVVHSSNALETQFDAYYEQKAYTIRLVVAEPDLMPSLDLTGESLPECDNRCAATEVHIHGPYSFEAIHAFPDVVLLTWSGVQLPTIQRSSDHGATWLDPDRIWERPYYMLQDGFLWWPIVQGDEYHFRMKAETDTEWTYLGGGSSAPGETVTIPVWAAPRPMANFSAADYAVNWHLPAGASLHQGDGTLTLRLDPESGSSLAGYRVKVYLNENTHQLLDGMGRDPQALYGSGMCVMYDAPADQPGCVERKPTPDFDFVEDVPPDQSGITVEIPNIVYGANSFRFVVTDPDDESVVSERAFLFPVHEHNQYYGSYKHEDLLPVLFGSTLGRAELAVRGLGPASRRSPHCSQSDSVPEDDELRSNGVLYYAYLSTHELGAPEPTVTRVATGIDGTWQAQIGPFAPGATVDLSMQRVVCGSNGWTQGSFDGSPSTPNEAQICGTADLPAQQLTVVVDPVNPTPELGHAPESVFVPWINGGSATVEFRLLDSWHDVELATVTVTSLQGGAATTVTAYYAADQLRAEGDWGWMVAELPSLSPGDAQLEFRATDLGGNSMFATRPLIVNTPKVRAVITSPEPGGQFPVYSFVDLAGEDFHVQGGVEARWVFFGKSDSSYVPLSAYEQEGLDASVMIPRQYDPVKARLVVALPGTMPENRYTVGLPCTFNQGAGECDSTEIELGNSCCNSSGFCYGDSTTGLTLTLTIDPNLNGSHHGPDEELPLTALMQGGTGLTFSYRWLIAPLSAPQDRILLTDPGEYNTGFSPDNTELEGFVPLAAGVSGGAYVITVEAGYVDPTHAGCIDKVMSASATVYFDHTLDAVAPGSALPGDEIRVYGRTILSGSSVTVILDNEVDEPVEIAMTPVDDGFVDVTVPDLTPADTWVALAGGDGAGQSEWRRALTVVERETIVDGGTDPSCSGGQREAALAIASGQTITGSWCDQDDSDYFFFAAGAGSTYDIVLERVDDGLADHNPATVDPELIIADPFGLPDISNGYSNDRSIDETDAAIFGFTVTKPGLQFIICRTTRSAGDYRLTVTRVGQAATTTFSVAAYGARAVNIVPMAGEASSTTLSAIVLDPRGLPAGGAVPQWTVRDGAVTSLAPYSSNGDGQAFATVTLGAAGAAAVVPSFDWPMSLVKQGAVEPPRHLPRGGPIVGRIMVDGQCVVHAAMLPDAAVLKERKRESDQMLRLTGDVLPPAKALAACEDLNSLKVREITPPEGATTLDTITLEVLEPETGEEALDPLTGLMVEERKDLQLRLSAFWDGSSTGVPLSGADILLQVADYLPASTRGVIVGGGGDACPTALTSSADPSTPFTFETGTCSQLREVGAANERIYEEMELLAAMSWVKLHVPGTGWVTKWAEATVHVAPEPGEPDRIAWMSDPDVVAPPGWESSELIPDQDPEHDKFACIKHGPAFCVHDEFNNLVVLDTSADSPWHRNVTGDKVFVADLTGAATAGAEGAPPWAVLIGGGGATSVFTTAELTSGLFDDPYQQPPLEERWSGKSTWTACARKSTNEVICSEWSMDNGSDLNWIFTLPEFFSNTMHAVAPGSPKEDWFANPDTWRVSPGQPLRLPTSGRLAAFRVDPLRTDDLEQPHDPHFTGVDVQIWLNGPSSGPFVHTWTREGSAAEWELARAEDVEITTGWIDNNTGANCEEVQRWDNVYEGGTATLTAFSDHLANDIACPDPGTYAAAFAITKAPRAPGWYNVMVETDDPRFQHYSPMPPLTGVTGHHVVHSFEVTGGRFLDDQYRRFAEDPIQVENPLIMRAVFSSESSSPTLPVTIRALVGDVVFDQVSLDAQLDGPSPSGGWSYSARFQAIPSVNGADPTPPDPPSLAVPPLEFALDAQLDEPAGAQGKQGSTVVVMPTQAWAAYGVDFGDLDPSVSQEPRRILVSNCPDANPGCVGMPLLYAKQTAVATDAVGPEVEVTLSLTHSVAPIPPEHYCILLRLEDPPDRSLYSAQNGDDNLDRLRAVGNMMLQSVDEVLPGGGASPAKSVVVAGKKYYTLALDSSHSATVKVKNLSRWPGDNYQLIAFLRAVSEWRADGTPVFSVPFVAEPSVVDGSADLEIWDRLFIEDDEGYSRGMVFWSTLHVGQNQVNLLAADFSQDADAWDDLGCLEHQMMPACCASISGVDCIHPRAVVFDAEHQTPVEVQVETVDCGTSLANPYRLTHECTVTLLDSVGSPLSLPYDLLWLNETAALVAGGRLKMPEAARSYIQQNLEAVFFEPVFLPREGSPREPGQLPKVPRECVNSGPNPTNQLDWSWRWGLLTPYFDNNQPSPPDLVHRIDNVIQVASHSDYLDADPGCTPPGVDRRSGATVSEYNFSEVYKDHIDSRPDLPASWRHSVWIHELVHQFAVNDCDPVSDHSVEVGPTVIIGQPGVCLMNVSLLPTTVHGPYLGAGSALPNTTGATVPRNTSCWSGVADWKYLRFQHRLNVSPY